MGMTIETAVSPGVLISDTALTTATVPFFTKTKPSGAGVVEVYPNPNGAGRTWAKAVILGNANDATLTSLRCHKWQFCPRKTNLTGNEGWYSVLLWEYGVTFGNCPGIAGTSVPATYFAADTLTLRFGNEGVSVETLSPASATVAINDMPGEILFDMKGAHLLQFEATLGTATGFNVLLSRM